MLVCKYARPPEISDFYGSHYTAIKFSPAPNYQMVVLVRLVRMLVWALYFPLLPIKDEQTYWPTLYMGEKYHKPSYMYFRLHCRLSNISSFN